MEVFLTPDKGWGVRAAAFVPRGTFIVEYAGEVRPTCLRSARARVQAWEGRHGHGKFVGCGQMTYSKHERDGYAWHAWAG